MIQDFLSAYPEDYTFLKDSIYYDVRARPIYHFKAFHKLAQLYEALTFDQGSKKFKSFAVYPLRTTYIPSYVTIDKAIVNYHVLRAKNLKDAKFDIWGKVVNLSARAFKAQGNNKSLRFHGTIETDGIGVSILKQNVDTGRRQKNKGKEKSVSSTTANRSMSIKKMEKDGFSNIEDLSNEDLLKMKDKCVLIDPGRRDVLYCMKETSTAEEKELSQFTMCERNKNTRRYRYLTKALKPTAIQSAELVLVEIHTSTVDQARFVEHLQAKAKIELVLKLYYGNETLDDVPHDFCEPVDFKVTDSGDLYYGNRLLFITRIRGFLPDIDRNLEGCSSARTDIDKFLCHLQLLLSVHHLWKRLTEVEINQLSHIIKETLDWLKVNGAETTENYEKKKKDVMHEAHKILSKLFLLPFRKMKPSSKLYHDKCDEKLVKNLKGKFGPDAVLVIGNWSAPNMKFHEPTRNKGLLRTLEKNGLSVYLINEYKTSIWCPECKEHQLEPFKKVQNPRKKQRVNRETAICHGLLR
ncbi:hypothetical protein RMATCC62417_17951 [Rhizopus microsporus]|nr:hypothetical protein RMATCC62417_17951 [Rhizopus microsporus]